MVLPPQPRGHLLLAEQTNLVSRRGCGLEWTSIIGQCMRLELANLSKRVLAPLDVYRRIEARFVRIGVLGASKS